MISNYLTIYRMGFFGAAHYWGGGKMMKLGTVTPYPNKIQKIYESRDTPLFFCLHQHFFTGNQQILIYQEKQI